MTKFRVQRFLIKAHPTAEEAADVNYKNPACYNPLEGLCTFAHERKEETTLMKGHGEISTAPGLGLINVLQIETSRIRKENGNGAMT